MVAVVVRAEYMIAVLALWLFAVPALFGYSQSNDPVLKYMCSSRLGETFWKDLMQCDVVLNDKFMSAFRTCIPTSTEDEAESTRNYVCSYPEKWTKMMECVNSHLIEMQDDKDTHLEISPSGTYITCVQVLLSEAERALKTGEAFL